MINKKPADNIQRLIDIVFDLRGDAKDYWVLEGCFTKNGEDINISEIKVRNRTYGELCAMFGNDSINSNNSFKVPFGSAEQHCAVRDALIDFYTSRFNRSPDALCDFSISLWELMLPHLKHCYTNTTLNEALRMVRDDAVDHKVELKSLEETKEYLEHQVRNCWFVWITGKKALELMTAVLENKPIEEIAKV